MSLLIFPTKTPSERRNYKFDFSAELASGETISSATATSTVWSGADASAWAMVSGSAVISGGLVTQYVINGVAGVIYYLNAEAVTSASRTLSKTGYLTVLREPV